MSWTPTLKSLDELPLIPGDQKAYEVSDVQGKDILVYAFITINEAEPGFKRGYYEIFTKSKDGNSKYSFYMNVACVNDTIVNSCNIWLPWGDAIEPFVYATLHSADEIRPKKKVKGCKGKDARTIMREYKAQGAEDDEHIISHMFVTGYGTK